MEQVCILGTGRYIEIVNLFKFYWKRNLPFLISMTNTFSELFVLNSQYKSRTVFALFFLTILTLILYAFILLSLKYYIIYDYLKIIILKKNKIPFPFLWP